MTYYFVSNNERKGPYELEELKAMGVITPDTLVWTNGMPDWVKASEVADMQVILNPTMAANDYSAYQPQQEPVQQQYQEPVQPQYQEPVQPQYQEPVQPQYQEPVQPQYQQPAQPQYQQPAQPQYQQPAQPQYQQPYQQPYEAPKKKKSKAWLWILLGLLVAALAVMAIMNPSKSDHVKAIGQEMSKMFDKVGGEMGAVMNLMGDKITPMLEKELDYHNYVFFSTVTDKKGERLSWGLFGNVWATVDEDGKQLKELQESLDALKNLGGSTDLDTSTGDDSNSDFSYGDSSSVATTPNDDDIPDLNLDDLEKELDKAGNELNDALNDLQKELDNL